MLFRGTPTVATAAPSHTAAALPLLVSLMLVASAAARLPQALPRPQYMEVVRPVLPNVALEQQGTLQGAPLQISETVSVKV